MFLLPINKTILSLPNFLTSKLISLIDLNKNYSPKKLILENLQTQIIINLGLLNSLDVDPDLLDKISIKDVESVFHMITSLPIAQTTSAIAVRNIDILLFIVLRILLSLLSVRHAKVLSISMLIALTTNATNVMDMDILDPIAH